MPVIRASLAQGQSVQMKPMGSSMLPMLRQGIDSVVLSPLPEELKKYDLVLYQSASGGYLLHRIVEVKNGVYTCVGDNRFAHERGITRDQMIAVVKTFYRGEKKHQTDEVGYQIYCRGWFCYRKFISYYRRIKNKLRRLIGEEKK